MRIGIEIEYWTVDRDGELASAADIVDACDGVDYEMAEPLLEVKTPPCDSLAELTAVLTSKLERVHAVAQSHDRYLVPLGTPLGDEDVPHRSTPQTEMQRAVIGENFAHAGYCAGTHVHFEQDSVVDQLRVLTALDPAFALVNTTPYYRGTRVAACARPHVYRRRCYQSLSMHGQLWEYPDSAEEWRERIDQRFEVFVDAARESSVDAQTVKSTFSPAGALWSPVCLRDDLGTVEWRAPDAAPPLDLCQLVADVMRLVDVAGADGTRVQESTRDSVPDSETGLALPSFDRLLEYVESAIDCGLSDPDVERYLDGFGIDVDAYDPIGGKLGSDQELEESAARQLRLQAASRFEDDLDRLSGHHETLDDPSEIVTSM